MSPAELKQVSLRIMGAALSAADPAAAVRRNLAAAGQWFTVCGREHRPTGSLTLAAVGKAASGMADAALEVLGPRLSKGIVVLPRGYPRTRHPGFEVLEAGHPVPDEGGLAAAERLSDLAAHLQESDILLLLLSGGGSSLLPLPYPPLSLGDKIESTQLLLRSGASIQEINTVRKHLSAIKGGRLAAKTRGTIVTLAISDVVGDQLAFVSSGPAVPDPTTFADAADVLARYDLLERVPAAVRTLIAEGVAGRIPETPKHFLVVSRLTSSPPAVSRWRQQQKKHGARAFQGSCSRRSWRAKPARRGGSWHLLPGKCGGMEDRRRRQ